MANDEEYEIMPHRTIANIKKELEALKEKSKSKQEISSPGFKRSVDNLTESINSLMDIFKEAAEEMKVETKTEENIEAQLGPLVKKVNEIEEENKRIAEGIVVIGDMVKELKEKSERPGSEARPAPRHLIPPHPMKFRRELPSLKEFKPRREIPPQRPIPTPMTGRPIPPRPMPVGIGAMPARREAMPAPGPIPPRPFPGLEEVPMPGGPRAMPGGPGAMPGGPGAMPAPPEPPKKKKGFLGLFKK